MSFITRPLRDLPNRLGFRFIAVYKGGEEREAEVIFKEVTAYGKTYSIHSVADFELLAGWREATAGAR